MKLTQQQTQTIIDNGKLKGLATSDIIDSLVKNGYEPEGVNVQAIQQKLQPKPVQTVGQDLKSDFLGIGKDIIAGSQKRSDNIADIREKMQSGEKGNIPAIFETAGQLAGAGADAIGNVFKGGVKMLLSPKSEEKVKGLVADFGQTVMENPQVQGAIKWYDQLPEAQQDALDAVGGFASLASEFIGVGAGKRLATGVKEVVDTGIDVTKQGAKQTRTGLTTGLKTVKDTAQDIIPTASDLRDRTLARALRLAPVEDISRIKQATGNDIGEFMNRFELVKDTPAETVDAISKFQKQNYNRVRDAIALDDGVYTFKDIPEMQDTIDLLKNDLAGRKSVEYKNAISTLENIENKGEFDLIEVQYVKSLADDVESLYKRSGEVKDSILMQDKAQTINKIRGFIEDRVTEKYPDIDIRALNNNTRTSRAILDAVIKRGSKADTSSFFQLGDLAVLGVGNFQTPGLGYGALFTKKVFESSPIQLRLSRFFSGKANAKQVVEGLTPAKLKELDTMITKELKASIDDVETVSKLQEVQSAIASTNTIKSIPKMSSISPKSTTATPKVNTKAGDNLITEAKKYKSAEEFVKAKTNAYHGTDKVFEKFDLSKVGTTQKLDKYGMFFTSDKQTARNYSSLYPQKSKVNWTPQDKINAEKAIVMDAFIKDSDALTFSEVIDLYEKGKIKTKVKSEGFVRPSTYFDMNRDSIKEAMEVTGKDVFKITKEGETFYMVNNPNKMMSKSQLTDIWNKANKK